MTKRRVLSTILTLALLLMGFGYAAWTQTFTVNATVTTGELKVAVVDLGTDTEITRTSVLDGNGNTVADYDYSAAALGMIVNTYDGFTKLELPANAGLPYYDVSMQVPDDAESLTLHLDEAYPGLAVEATVNYKNLGTLPVELSCMTMTGQYIKFIGVGTNAALANELLAQGFVQFTVDPTQQYGPVFQHLYPEGQAELDFIMTISPLLKETIEVDGLIVEVENQSLQYQLVLDAKQAIGCDDSCDCPCDN